MYEIYCVFGSNADTNDAEKADVWSYNLKKGTACSYETLINSHDTNWSHISEYRNAWNNACWLKKIVMRKRMNPSCGQNARLIHAKAGAKRET